MNKKTLVATAVFVFLLVSSVWASPPKGALMDEYMKKRFVIALTPSASWAVDMANVVTVMYEAGNTSNTVHLKNGITLVVPASAAGYSPIDQSYTIQNLYYAWVEYLKFVRSNPQFLNVP